MTSICTSPGSFSITRAASPSTSSSSLGRLRQPAVGKRHLPGLVLGRIEDLVIEPGPTTNGASKSPSRERRDDDKVADPPEGAQHSPGYPPQPAPCGRTRPVSRSLDAHGMIGRRFMSEDGSHGGRGQRRPRGDFVTRDTRDALEELRAAHKALRRHRAARQADPEPTAFARAPWSRPARAQPMIDFVHRGTARLAGPRAGPALRSRRPHGGQRETAHLQAFAGPRRRTARCGGCPSAPPMGCAAPAPIRGARLRRRHRRGSGGGPVEGRSASGADMLPAGPKPIRKRFGLSGALLAWATAMTSRPWRNALSAGPSGTGCTASVPSASTSAMALAQSARRCNMLRRRPARMRGEGRRVEIEIELAGRHAGIARELANDARRGLALEAGRWPQPAEHPPASASTTSIAST